MTQLTRFPRPPRVRWGFVGTGNIASWMAAVVRTTPLAQLSAVASRSSGVARTTACRDEATGSIIAAEGQLTFTDGVASAWRCGFDADVTKIGLKLLGRRGQIRLDNFVGEDETEGVGYRYSRAGTPDPAAKRVQVDSRFSGPSLMFQDFAAAARDTSLRDPWIQASTRTQSLLDAARAAADR